MYSERRRELGEKAKKLHAAGVLLQQQQQLAAAGTSSNSRLLPSWGGFRREQHQLQQERRFKLAVYVLEKEYRQLVVAMKERGENPFFAYLKLAAGMIAVILSCLWILHIFFYFIVSQISGQEPHGFLRFLDWFFEVTHTHVTTQLNS